MMAMEKALEITRSVEECEITCDGHSGLAPDEEIIDCYVTEGSLKEAAQYWPEAPLSANYFADSLMFCREE